MALMIASVLLPLAVGALLPFVRGKRANALVWLGALITLLCNAFCALVSGGACEISLGGGFTLCFALDDFARLFYLASPLLTLLTAVFSLAYCEKDKKKARLYGFMLLTQGALNGLFLAGNLFTLYLFFEFVSLLSYPLVLHEGTEKARHAGLTYLGFSVAGAALILCGMLLVGEKALCAFSVGGVGVAGETAVFAFLLIGLGFGCKAGLYPLSAWLPIAHPEAPAPASALLSGVITKAGVVGFVRACYGVFGGKLLAGSYAQKALLCLALASILIGSFLAYKEPLLKKRLAYSSVSQLSYALAGFLLLNEQGYVGGLQQALFHMLAKTGLFLCAGAIIHETGRTRVAELRGVGREMPATLSCFALLSLSLIGIPPLGGFIAKWSLCEGALAYGGTIGTLIVVVLILSALLTAGYLLPIVANGFFPGKDFVPQNRKEDGRFLLPLTLLCALALILGAFPALCGNLFSAGGSF